MKGSIYEYLWYSKEIRESDVFKNLKNARERIYADPEKKELVEEFDKLKIEVQLMEIKQQNHEEVNQEDKRIKMAKLYNTLIANKDIKEYFDLQVQFNQMMIDINKIIGDVVKDVF